MSIIHHVTLQKIVTHDFRYDLRIYIHYVKTLLFVFVLTYFNYQVNECDLQQTCISRIAVRILKHAVKYVIIPVYECALSFVTLI